MGKKKSQRKGSSKMDDTDDDTMSTDSTKASSVLSFEMEENQDNSVILDGYVDALYEKRSKTREDGLKGLLRLFKCDVLVDYAESKYETLLHMCINSLKKGGSAEALCASYLIGLLVITTGAGSAAQQVVTEASPHLMKIAKQGLDPKVRIAAIESLAMIMFVGSLEVEKTEEAMDSLLQISKHKGNEHAEQSLGIAKPSSEVRAAALSAWTLLLTIIPSRHIITSYLPKCLSTLSTLLGSDDHSLRVAAGEAVALLEEAKSEDDLKGNVMQATQNQIYEQIQLYATEAGGRGQSNKKSQRAAFKDIIATLEGQGAPALSVKLQQRDALKIDTWCQVLQLRALTSLLGEGLQRHLQENELLHEIFGFVPKREKRQTLTPREKRLFMSPNSVASKARTQLRNSRRAAAHAGHIGHFNVNELDND